jgi:DNA recombination protein RmuC
VPDSQTILITVVAALAGAVFVLAIVSWRTRSGAGPARLEELQRRQEQASERLERELRAAVENAASGLRMETSRRLNELQTGLVSQVASLANVQTTQLSAFGQQMQQQGADLGSAVRTNLVDVRQTLEARLLTLQQGNETRLEQMRATVEEKLQSALEARLGESFRLVSERLEQVHRGLGEMQVLAQGVGDLKRVLSNVKTRGMLGEMQLGALLEQVLAPDQYEMNVRTRPGSKEPVDFAVKLPGKSDGRPVWLPIDAKFPTQDYERLLVAHESADKEAVEAAARALEQRIRLEAKSIREKYVEAPHTTDFAILFLPTEGLFAEVLRRPGLTEALNRDLRVVIAGPTTLFAMLNSLQMGFRTLALERRSSEVWQVLGAVKSEFAKFGDVLARLKGQLATASRTIDDAQARTRQMQRKLLDVESLPTGAQAPLFESGEQEPSPVQPALTRAQDSAPPGS